MEEGFKEFNNNNNYSETGINTNRIDDFVDFG